MFWLRHRLIVAHCFFFIFFLFFLLVFVDPCYFCGFPSVGAARSVCSNGACQVFFFVFSEFQCRRMDSVFVDLNRVCMSGVLFRIFRIPVLNGVGFWREFEVLFLYFPNSSCDCTPLLYNWAGQARYFFLIFPYSSDQVPCWLLCFVWLKISWLPSFFLPISINSLLHGFAFLMICSEFFTVIARDTCHASRKKEENLAQIYTLHRALSLIWFNELQFNSATSIKSTSMKYKCL